MNEVRFSWVVWLGLGCAVGCAPVAPAPELRTISPGWGWTGEVTDVTVIGERLFPSLVVGDQREEAQFNSAFQVYLETDTPTALDGVEFVNTSTLVAEVPAGVEPGTYDVRLVDPAGIETTLSQGFRVTETRADHLVFDVERVGYDVSEIASLGMRLEDPEGGSVAEPLLVEVRATSAEGAAGLEFGDGLLDEQSPLTDGVGVQGKLHQDGTAPLLLRSTIAQDLTLTLSAVSDSFITPATTLLSFSPGLPDHVVLSLPSEAFSSVAGEEIALGIEVVDDSGNVIDATGLQVYVYEDDDCGDLHQLIDLLSAGPYPITLTTACPANHLHAIGVGVSAADSEAFEVRAAEMQGYDLTAVPSSVVAGTGVLAVVVGAVDGFDNLVEDHVATITLKDSVGGLDSDTGVGEQACGSFFTGQAVCTATTVRAGSGITITATDEMGRTGVSNAIEVLPNVAVAVTVTPGVAVGEAGVPFSVVVQLLDEWDNAITFLPEEAVLVDDTGTLLCEPSAEGNFLCVITAAHPADVLSVEIQGLSGVSAPFLVTNSDLAAADVTASVSSVTAGDAFGVTVFGFDAYGNAYTTPVSGSTVTLSDLLGGMGAMSLTLDGSGSAGATVQLTVAGTDAILASAGGIALGASAGIEVLAGEVVDLRVLAPAWADIADGVPVEVTAVDAFENANGVYLGPVTVSLSGCASQATSDFSLGVALVDLVCEDVGFELQVLAEDDAMSGLSEPLDVLDFACPAGPVADLLLDGADEVVGCLVAEELTFVVDTSGTVPGDAPIAIWHLEGPAEDVRSLSAPTEVTFTESAGERVTVVVADIEGCASSDSAVGWVGANDGSPVGPLVVTPAATTVASGATTAVTVAATDCAGDVASAGTVFVWSDLGVVAGPLSTGSGLSLTLDGAGAGTFDVTFDSGYATTASVAVAGASGEAFGAADVVVTGDSVRPVVVSVTPVGTWTDAVSEVTVAFSEPMFAANFTALAVSLTGPDGAITTALAVSSDGRTLTVTPTDTLDPAAGTYTLTLSTNVRDVAGNRLSGDWSGNSASWTSTFGDVPSTVGDLGAACSFGASAIRPDGDDGDGAEADVVDMTLSATTAPSWWSLAVTSPEGDRLLTTRVAGARTDWSWDARGEDGRIVAEDSYEVVVSAVDVSGNEGEACAKTVVVSQRGRTP